MFLRNGDILLREGGLIICEGIEHFGEKIRILCKGMRYFFSRFGLLMLLAFCLGQETSWAQRKRFRVVEYNVENLFDTVHQEALNDLEYTPKGSRHWDSRRYWTKQDKLLRVIVACSGVEPADLVVLCEVENDTVLRDLTQRTRLRSMGYEFLMTRGSDPRGINVALMYQPFSFKPLCWKALEVVSAHNPKGSTRDILWVEGLTPTQDTLHLYCVHLPSRSGGQRATDKRRSEAVEIIASHIDSLRTVGREPKTLILGDFNDEWRNNSIRKVLGARPPRGKLRPENRYVLTANLKNGREIRGTYYFRQRWSQLDHVIVSGNLLDKQSRFFTAQDFCRIGAFDFLLERTHRGSVKPRRSYLGPVYHGGYSDHLPVVLDFYYEAE